MKKLLTLLCLCCLCIGGAWGEDYEKVLTLDCASASSNGSKDVYGVAATTSMNVEGIASFLNNAANIESGITVSDYSGSVYWTKGSGGSGIPDNVLKVGTASGTGKFCFTISNNYDNISKVVVVGYGWKNTSKLSVNSSATQSPTTAATETSFTFILPTATKAINLNVTTSAICITKIELYKEISSTKTLSSISVSGAPTKTTYEAGESFDPAGLVVTGTYDDATTSEITSGITWNVTPSGALTAGTTSVSVTATVSGITSSGYTVEGLTVNAAPLSVTWDATQQGYTNGQSVTSANLLDNGAISVSFVGGKYYTTGTAVRVYGGNKLTVSSKTLKITEIDFTFGSGDGTNTISANVGTYTNGKWEGKSSNVEFTVGGSDGHRRFMTIKVYYEEAGDIVANPTFSVESGIYFEPFTVTLASTTEGASIYYTTNGDDPTTASTLYENPINVSETTTIKAIAIKEGLENSEVVVKTFTFGPTYNSLADLVADGEPTGETVKVTLTNETITRLVTNGVMLKSGNQEVEIYNYDVPAEWVVGGTLSGTIICPWKKFGSSTWELCPTSWDDFTYTAPTALFNVIIAADITNGSVTANPSEAVEGQEITLTVTPADGYKFTSLTVTDAMGAPVEVSNNQFTMPASAVTVSATFVEKTKYTITWSVNGEIVKSDEVYEGDAVTAPTEVSAPSYSEKEFIGWVTSETVDASEEPTLVTPTTAIAPATYYAVFATATGGGEEKYVKVTSTADLADGKYLIVYETGSVALNGMLTADAASNTVAVTISDGEIASTTEIDAAAVTFSASNGSFLGGGGKYIGHTGASNTLNYSDAALANVVTFDNGDAVITASDYVMRYNKTDGQTRFRYYKSGQEAVQLYKLSGGVTYSDYCTTVTIPEASIECADLIELASTESGCVPFSVTLTAIDDMDVYLFSDAECTQDITETCDWFGAQFNDASLNVDYYALANPLHATRTVYMQLFALDSDANEITKVVTVIQAASTDPYLNIDDNLNVEADEQSLSTTATMCNIKDNYSLTLSLETGCDWITNLNFDGNDVTFDVAANKANSPREATITWTYAPVQPQGVDAPEYTGTFTVTQAAADKVNLILTWTNSDTPTKSYVEEGGSVTLTDAGIKSIEITEDIENVNITYTRSFGNTNWQAWYMPFEIDPADLPEGFEVAYINDNHIIDGDIKIEIVALEAGQIMMANHPYVIKAPAADTYEIKTTSTLYQTKENTIDCSSTTNMFYFNGTYQLTSMDNVVGKPYGLSGGKFTSLEGYDSKPYRFYMNIVPRDGSQYITLPNEIKLVNIFGEDLDDADAISEIKSESVREGAYDLMGRKATGLVKGNIYIINGKKVLVK